MAWLYIVRCSNGRYYTGSTRLPIELRVWQHNQGLGANFTRKHRPVTLVFGEEFHRADEAWERENQVKGWSRAKKEALIAGDLGLLPALSMNRVRRVAP